MTDLDFPTAQRLAASQPPRRREQRLEPRKAVQLSAVVQPRGGRAIRATIVNLSKHGVELICLVDLRPATTCRLRFTSTAGLQPQVVRAHACVVRSRREGSGYRIGLLLSAATPRANDLLECLASS
ncbi:PilZ domain-containing protein [Ideonella sp. YS5]|uniref:PilZ domain-containing protein n=1 Tax=Ideonella sp. YS5 TaxID=3453714 RepID=UPI003EEE0A82